LEVPIVLVSLLAPTRLTFCVASIVNACFDVLFAYSLDALQIRNSDELRVSTSPAAHEWQHSEVFWSPRFCIERPVSVMATLLNGAKMFEPSETEPCLSARGCLDGGSLRGSGNEPTMGSIGSTCGPNYSDANTRITEESCPRFSGTMSPRVSALLDEYDAAVIDCRMSASCEAQALYLFQDRRLTLTAHLLGSIVAIGFAAFACAHTPKLWSHGSGWYELVWRVSVLCLLRAIADILACGTLEYSSTNIHKHGRAGLWESRHELSNFYSWLFRALIGIGSLLASLAATSVGVVQHS